MTSYRVHSIPHSAPTRRSSLTTCELSSSRFLNVCSREGAYGTVQPHARPAATLRTPGCNPRRAEDMLRLVECHLADLRAHLLRVRARARAGVGVRSRARARARARGALSQLECSQRQRRPPPGSGESTAKAANMLRPISIHSPALSIRTTFDRSRCGSVRVRSVGARRPRIGSHGCICWSRRVLVSADFSLPTPPNLLRSKPSGVQGGDG